MLPCKPSPGLDASTDNSIWKKEASKMQKITECDSESPSGFTISHQNRHHCTPGLPLPEGRL